jgi:hypothetical protein
MIVWCRRFVLPCLLALATPSAWAANPTLLLDGTNGTSLDGSLTWYGFAVSATCTIASNGGAATPCAAGNNLELAAVPSGRGTLTFEILNTGGTSSAILAAASGSSGNNVLTVGLTFALSNGTPNTYTAIQPATVSAVGYADLTHSTSGVVSTASAVFTNATVAPNSLAANLTPEVNAGTVVQQAPSTTSTSFTADNSFTVTSTLTLNANGHTVNDLQYNVLALKLRTAPEPATLSIFVLGLGGIMVARRRRARS